MKMRILGLVASIALTSAAAYADKKESKAAVTAIQAELMADMHARLLKPGAIVFARVTVAWQGSGCSLRDGAVLEGHVIAVVPHTRVAKGSEVDIAFTRAQCGADEKAVSGMGAFEALLSAIAAPPENSDLGIMGEKLPAPSIGYGGGQQAHYSMLNQTDYNLTFETQILQFPIVPHMEMGYVGGIRGLRLNVGAGPENSSVLLAKDRDVQLEKHTLLLLVPAASTFPLAAANSPANTGAVEPVAAVKEAATQPPPVDDIDVCAPPTCNVALPSGSAIDAGNAASSIAIGQLGYAARPDRQMNSFDHDEALAYLGPRQLVVAFNPHKLVTRRALGSSGKTARIIRAVLIDTTTHQVIRTLDWESPDHRQYLWQLSKGRILVHVGAELRIYGDGLKMEDRVALDGPLSFVRVTPDGSFMTIGVLRERHSPELHAQLAQSLDGAEPEEDVRIIVLNRNFEKVVESATRSGLMAPTLLNEGQAKILALPNNRYRINMQTWDNHVRTVTQFNSSCTPELSSIAPDLLFLVSCDKQTEGRSFRVLRPDGKVALKGDSTLNECGHAAEGSVNADDFVVKIVQSSLPMPPGAIFQAQQFTAENLGVYRAADGKRLFSVKVGSPTTSRDGYALAPDGAQLAVLTREEIALYSVPAK